MVEIQFVEEPEEPYDEPAPVSDPRLHRPPRHGLVVSLQTALWAAAAVLTVIACFQNIYRMTSSSTFGRTVTGVDGWGHEAGLTSGGSHGPRWGVVLCVAATLLLAAAGARAAHRQAWLPLAVAGIAVLGTSLVMTGLAVSSAFDNERSLNSQVAGDFADRVPGAALDLHVGWLIWLGLIAFVVAGVAFLTPRLMRSLAGPIG